MLGVLLEPKGFIKILQFIFVISAFSCACDFTGQVIVHETCAPEEKLVSNQTNSSAPPEVIYDSEDENLERVYQGRIEYPYNLNNAKVRGKNCTNDEVTLQLLGNYSSESKFYVFVGVTAMLYVVLALFTYTFLEDSYRLAHWMPLCDLGGHIIFTVLWFGGAVAFASALTSIKTHTGIKSIMEVNEDLLQCYQGQDSCYREKIKWDLLDFSVVFGFLNVVLFGSNIWFVYKETRLFSVEPQPTLT